MKEEKEKEKTDVPPALQTGHRAHKGEGGARMGEASDREGGGVWILGLGFNSVDMSLCVVLYVCSALFLMFLFFFFKVRSRRWKLRYSRLPV